MARSKRTIRDREPRTETPHKLDDLDYQIIALLRKDGRTTNRQLSGYVGVTEWTVANRIRRMQDSGVLRLVAVADPRVGGFEYVAIVGVEVEGRSAIEVAEQIGELDDVPIADVVSGNYDVRFVALAKDRSALVQLLKYGIPAIEGIRRVEASLALEVAKWESGALLE